VLFILYDISTYVLKYIFQYLDIILRYKILFLLGKGFEQTALCSNKRKIFQKIIVLRVLFMHNIVEKFPPHIKVTTSYYCLVLKTDFLYLHFQTCGVSL
jgi:hypothetical protein